MYVGTYLYLTLFSKALSIALAIEENQGVNILKALLLEGMKFCYVSTQSKIDEYLPSWPIYYYFLCVCRYNMIYLFYFFYVYHHIISHFQSTAEHMPLLKSSNVTDTCVRQFPRRRAAKP